MLRQAGYPWARGRHEHGPACGHQADGFQVQRSAQGEEHAHEDVADHSAAGQKALLDAAMASPSRSLPAALLAEAMPFFQNPNLSATRLHDNPVAQRATAALGARAMTVGNHIFAPPQVVADKKVMGHELSHVNENLKGTLETGHSNGAGVTITDPGQSSELKAERDGASFGSGAATAPSVVAQRAVTHGGSAAIDEGASTTRGTAVQRMYSPPRGRRGSEGYEADSEHVAGPGGEMDMDRLMERLDRLNNTGRRSFRRMAPRTASEERVAAERQRIADEAYDADAQQAAARTESESESASEAGTSAPVHPAGPLADLPEHEDLTPLRDLLLNELSDGRLSRKLKVTFKVNGGDRDPRRDTGHAWIVITGSDGTTVPFGFYPRQGIEYWGNVRGGVMCPDWYDTRGYATHRESKMVPLRNIINGYRLTYERVAADYNFTRHNCSTFAGDVWRVMTGRSIPREWFTAFGMLGTVISTPQGAAEGLEAHQTRRYNRRREALRPLTESAMRWMIPHDGLPDELAHWMALSTYSQSGSASDGVDD
ncbi:hypothetical protein AQJ30_09070 [Streptomyces longwoodensis]|uniref:eCIS core domain-containing protein n=2 Tax=Streptomyces longwoodensis TaxID=68231 RepID=A0A101R1K4_9ACTN|nr:hypothetical protein AQJ30_09070 [Streptomyces longwoodensis]